MMAWLLRRPWRAATIAAGLLSAALLVQVLVQRAEIATHLGARNTAAQALRTAAAALETTASRIRAAEQQARADALARAREIERRDAAAARKVEVHVKDRLSTIAARVDGLRAETADRTPAGGPRPACVPTPAGAIHCPLGAAAADGILVDPVILGAAQHAAEIALGWQLWWREVQDDSEAPPTPTPTPTAEGRERDRAPEPVRGGQSADALRSNK